MIKLYKNIGLRQMALYGQLPLVGRYYRWSLRRYQQNFWRTWTIDFTVTLVVMLGAKAVARRMEQKQLVRETEEFLADYELSNR